VQLPWLEQRGNREALRRELLGVTKERMLREMAEALEALTATTPFILVLEDLHWSDYSTLDMVGMLARRLERARLLVLGTYRSADVIVSGHPLRDLIRELKVRRQCERHRAAIPTRAACRRVSGPAIRRTCLSTYPCARGASADGRQSALHGAGGGRARRPACVGVGGRPLAAEKTG
jgi:hypothetical protein